MKHGEEALSLIHPGKGILLNNPRSSVRNKDLRKLRYLYKVPGFVEIHAPEAYEWVDCVVLGWISLYEIPL